MSTLLRSRTAHRVKRALDCSFLVFCMVVAAAAFGAIMGVSDAHADVGITQGQGAGAGRLALTASSGSSSADAEPIPLNEMTTGILGRERWYAVTLPEAGTLTITLQTRQWEHHDLSYSAACDLILYDESARHELVYAFTSSGGRLTGVKSVPIGLSAGTYLIRVRKPDQSGLYGVHYWFTPQFEASAEWEQEPNDIWDSATPIALDSTTYGSISMSGDNDWYKIELPAAGNLNVTFQASGYSRYSDGPDVLLYDSGRNRLGYGRFYHYDDNAIKGVRNEHVLDNISLNAGVYYIKVEDVCPLYYHIDTPYSLYPSFDRSIERLEVPQIDPQVYTGDALTPSPVVRFGSTMLQEGVDYSLSYDNNTNVGTAGITITAQGDYEGVNHVTFEIVKRKATIAANDAAKVYDGAPLTAKAAGYTLDGFVRDSDVASVTLAGSITDAGTGRAEVAAYTLAEDAAGNYDIRTRSGTLVVEPASIANASILLSPTSFAYDGSPKTPVVSVLLDGAELAAETDYSVSYSDNTNAGTATATVEGKGNYADAQTAVFEIVAPGRSMNRLYNPNSGEHFYTASGAERDFLVRAGWRSEGEGWMAPAEGASVYRLYNSNAGDHHYTTSAGERDFLVSVGWSYEGEGWKSAGEGGVPLYRLYNPNATGAGSHHYTTSAAERDHLVRLGWNAEGVGWYGV